MSPIIRNSSLYNAPKIGVSAFAGMTLRGVQFEIDFGFQSRMERLYFLASQNYPEQMPGRAGHDGDVVAIYSGNKLA